MALLYRIDWAGGIFSCVIFFTFFALSKGRDGRAMVVIERALLGSC